MDLRCKIYLVDKEPTMPGPILGSKPPSVEQVFLKFRENHKRLQEKSGGRSSIREAATLTAHEVHEWWSQTGIQVKKENQQTSCVIVCLQNMTDASRVEMETNNLASERVSIHRHVYPSVIKY